MRTRPVSVRRGTAPLSAMALLVWSGSALPQPYKAAELGLLPGGTNTYAAAINNGAQVVGTADEGFDNPAVIWNGTIPTAAVDAGPASSRVGSAINNLGVMVGGGYPPNGAFIWSPTISNRLGPLYGIYSPNGINDSGTIVGDGPPGLALFWASPYATTWTLLPQLFPKNFSLSSASGVNNAGQIVGASVLVDDYPFVNGAQHATLWSGEKVTDLGTLEGPTAMPPRSATPGRSWVGPILKAARSTRQCGLARRSRISARSAGPTATQTPSTHPVRLSGQRIPQAARSTRLFSSAVRS